MKKAALKTLLVVLFSVSFIISYAQHHEDASHSEGTHHEEGAHEGHEFHKNHVALFNGATTNLTHNLTSYSIGLDYEYRFSKMIGAGVLGEFVASESPEMLVGISVFTHPYKGAILFVAPMALFASEEEGAAEAEDSELPLAIRIGAGYDFHFGKLSVGPSVSYDMGNTSALAYGLAIGFGF